LADRAERTGRAGSPGQGLLLLGIILIAVNLRPVISSFGPLVGEIRADTGVSAAAIGVLGTLPVLCFGIFSAFAPRLARRFGMEGFSASPWSSSRPGYWPE
jgi:CP family cyanate transporter-like MFS transporter